MKRSYLPLMSLLLTGIFFVSSIHAQNAPLVYASIKSVIETVPKPLLEGLTSTGKRLDKSLVDANEHLRLNVVDKQATVTVKVKVLNIENSPGQARAFRLQVADMPVRVAGSAILVRMWVLFGPEDAATVAKIRKGSDITVTGSLTRALFNAYNGLKLDTDLDRCKIK